MRIHALIAAAGVLALGGAASAGTSTLVFPITNNTADPWNTVSFELRLPRGTTVSPAAFAALQFAFESSRHSSTKNPFDLVFDESEMKKITFDYTAFTPMTSSDGRVEFSVTVNNPFNIPFRVHMSKTIVPAPAGVAMLGVAGVMTLRRRRVA